MRRRGSRENYSWSPNSFCQREVKAEETNASLNGKGWYPVIHDVGGGVMMQKEGWDKDKAREKDSGRSECSD